MPGLQRPAYGQGGSRIFQIFKCHPSTSFCSVAALLLQQIFLPAVTEKKKENIKARIPDFEPFHMKVSCAATIAYGRESILGLVLDQDN